jgi:hypothetical protein
MACRFVLALLTARRWSVMLDNIVYWLKWLFLGFWLRRKWSASKPFSVLIPEDGLTTEVHIDGKRVECHKG